MRVAVEVGVGVREAVGRIVAFNAAAGVVVGSHTGTPGTLSSREPAIQRSLLSRNQVPASFRATICKVWPAWAPPAMA